MLSRPVLALSVAAIALAQGPSAHAQQAPLIDMAAAEAKATATLKQMRPDEKVVLTHGIMALPVVPGIVVPDEAPPGAGYIAGIKRLGIPALTETDASLGVAWVGGLRKDGATALPSGLAQAATWNPDLLYKAGAMIGSEARAKGFNVLLAGGVNLMRDPRNGRTFEYLAEDPLLSGVLVGAAIRGIQSNQIIATIKHFALNGQETGRKFVDVKIAEGAARESDLLAFQIGIEQGQPGSVMCAYNRIHGDQACASDWLLNKVLKETWRWKGFVMSDWGAVPALDAAIKGLDQQSGEQLDPAVFFGKALQDKAASDPAYAARLDDMNKRVLTAIYAAGLDRNQVKPGGAIDFAANAKVAEETARQGIVLLKNNGLLPLARNAKSIAVIGGYADTGVLAGSGSSLVHGEGGPAATRSFGGDGPFAGVLSQSYHKSVPLRAIEAAVPGATVTFRDGRYIEDAVLKAKQADIAIVFANEWRTEGLDQPGLSLPEGQDALIAAVAAANPRTIVVLQTGGPVLMPWLDKVAGVIEAWYPGARGGPAIAAVLFGDANPSGRLPVTFPASLAQLPRPAVDGADWVEPDFGGAARPGYGKLVADYDIEGSDVGYRWFARQQHKALFPFGFGLSYTTFESGGLKISGMKASFTIRNTGLRSGAAVGQVYLVSRGGQPKQRLAGFARVELQPGAAQAVSVTFDPRVLADWKNGSWTLPAGDYTFALGDDAEHLGQPVTVRMAARSWKD